MGALTGLDDLTSRLRGATGYREPLWFWKDERIDDGATQAVWTQLFHYSMWRHNGFPTAGARPGATARNPTNATAGGLLQADPGGGRQTWMTGLQLATNGNHIVGFQLHLCDRLADYSLLDATVFGSAQNTTSLAVSRYTDGVGNEIWIEVYDQIGVTARTITAAYTDDTDTARVTDAVVFGGTSNREVGRFMPLPLHPTSKGVKSVQSVTIATGTTGTAGDFGVTIIHPLTMANIPGAGNPGGRNLATFQPGMEEWKTDACLMLYAMSTATAPPHMFGMLASVES